MNKEQLKEKYNKAVDDNFAALKPIKEHSTSLFLELDSIKQEILDCLMINLYQASITLTNHLLERLLKLALLYNDIGIDPMPVDDNQREKWELKHIEANKKFGILNLKKTIDNLASEMLISEDEKKILTEVIRDELRNGFSHADMGKILKQVPQSGVFFLGSLSEPNSGKQIKLNQKEISFIQALLQEDFAKKNALPYFKYVYGLLCNFEKKLYSKFKK